MPTEATPPAGQLARLLYLALLAWQWVWHSGILTDGQPNWILATVMTVLLLLPLRGILRLQHKPTLWGGFLALFFFMFGVMEAWTLADARLAAGVQIALSVAYIAALWPLWRKGR